LAVFGGKFERAVLLLSTGRTGTKALASYFDTAFENVCALHEPPRSRHLRVASNRHLRGRLSEQQLVETYAAARRARFAEIREPIYIESNPFLHGFVGVFDQVFDAPRIVHIVRDPRTYVRSYINHGAFRGIKGLAARYYPDWMIKPERLDPRAKRRWRDMSHVERIAWRWDTINGVLDRGEAVYGDRYLRVKFEDVFAEDGSGLRRLAEWIGLPTSAAFERLREERVNASQGRSLPRWEQWEASDQRAVLELCAARMERYGYSTGANLTPTPTPMTPTTTPSREPAQAPA
jgi:hypothetical protein